MFKSLDYISNLKNLKHLCFVAFVEIKVNQIYKTLKQMANNCQKLKSLELGLKIDPGSSDIRQLYEIDNVY